MCKTNTVVCEQPVGWLRTCCSLRAMDSVLAWMALLARSGKGARGVRREVSWAGSPVAAWQDWAKGHPLEAAATWDRAQRQLKSIEQLGAHVVTFHDPRYPALLAHIPDAPPVLYARGPSPRGGAGRWPWWARGRVHRTERLGLCKRAVNGQRQEVGWSVGWPVASTAARIKGP